MPYMNEISDVLKNHINIKEELLEHIEKAKNNEVRNLLSLLYKYIADEDSPDIIHIIVAFVICSSYRSGDCTEQRILKAIRDAESVQLNVKGRKD